MLRAYSASCFVRIQPQQTRLLIWIVCTGPARLLGKDSERLGQMTFANYSKSRAPTPSVLQMLLLIQTELRLRLP